jgi:[ribosomal protein S5]-alanine N-acetyltransferase
MREPSNSPPVVETERLVLRPARPDDAEAIFESYAADEEVTRYLVWRPHRSAEETREFLRGAVAIRADGTHINWAIAIKPDDRVRGMISFRRDGFKADVGYVLGRQFWGRGYMTEALGAVVAYGFSLPGLYRIWALCDVDNLASARVMEKAGMTFEGVLRRYVLHPNLSDEPRDARCYSIVR